MENSRSAADEPRERSPSKVKFDEVKEEEVSKINPDHHPWLLLPLASKLSSQNANFLFIPTLGWRELGGCRHLQGEILGRLFGCSSI